MSSDIEMQRLLEEVAELRKYREEKKKMSSDIEMQRLLEEVAELRKYREEKERHNFEIMSNGAIGVYGILSHKKALILQKHQWDNVFKHKDSILNFLMVNAEEIEEKRQLARNSFEQKRGNIHNEMRMNHYAFNNPQQTDDNESESESSGATES